MFLVFSSLQINDPDPIVWILIYGSMAVVCVMAAFDYYVRWLMIIQALGYVTYCIILFPGLHDWAVSPNPGLLFSEIAKMEFYYIEEAREFMGLCICLGTLVWFWIRSSRVANKAS